MFKWFGSKTRLILYNKHHEGDRVKERLKRFKKGQML